MLIPESLHQISTFMAQNVIPQCLSNISAKNGEHNSDIYKVTYKFESETGKKRCGAYLIPTFGH